MRKFYISKRRLKVVLKQVKASAPLLLEAQIESLEDSYLKCKYAYVGASRNDGFPVSVEDKPYGVYRSSPISLHNYIGKRY